MEEIIIISLGSGGEECLTRAAEAQLRKAERLVLRTERHPIRKYLEAEQISFSSLDDLYESTEDFDAFNQAAAERLLCLSRESAVTYAVSDSAFDSTVSTLLHERREGTQVRILPGVSHTERCLSLLGEHSAGLRIYSAEEFSRVRMSPDEPLLLIEVHSRETAGDCKLKLMNLLPEELEIVWISGDEKTGELVRRPIALYELDRQKHYDHLSAAYVPPVSFLERDRRDMDDLLRVMHILRSPEDGCPWDREQTYESLLPCLLEESHEYIQAVREKDPDHMYDELGDVLFQIVFHTEIAHEHADFEFEDVTSAICKKLIERHTHVFGAVSAEDSETVRKNWEDFKRAQRGISTHTQAMEGVSKALPTLLRASKILDKAFRAGFSPDLEEVAALLSKQLSMKEADGKVSRETLGQLLLLAAALCRLSGVDGDLALTEATDRFISRFGRMENAIKYDGKCLESLTFPEMVVYWSAENGQVSGN